MTKSLTTFVRILACACSAHSVLQMTADAEEPTRERWPDSPVVQVSPPPPLPSPPPFIEPGYSGTMIYVDEDTFMFPSSDQDYTTGFQFAFTGYFSKALTPPLRAFDWLTQMKRVHDGICDDKNSFCPKRAYQAHSLIVGLTFFTPRKGEPGDPDCEIQVHGCVLALTRPLHDDRPYASILYMTITRESAKGKTAWLSDFTLGGLGLGLGGKLQSWFHQGIGNDVTPGGWRYEISRGGELTAKYRVAWRRLLATRPRRSEVACGIHRLPVLVRATPSRRAHASHRGATQDTGGVRLALRRRHAVRLQLSAPRAIRNKRGDLALWGERRSARHQAAPRGVGLPGRGNGAVRGRVGLRARAPGPDLSIQPSCPPVHGPALEAARVGRHLYRHLSDAGQSGLLRK